MKAFKEWLKQYAAFLLTGVMLLTVIVKCVATAAGGNYLFADGANHLYKILQAGNAITNIDGRQGSFLLMELLTVLGMKLGITNINVLCALYGIGSVMWLGIFAGDVAVQKAQYEWIAVYCSVGGFICSD